MRRRPHALESGERHADVRIVELPTGEPVAGAGIAAGGPALRDRVPAAPSLLGLVRARRFAAGHPHEVRRPPRMERRLAEEAVEHEEQEGRRRRQLVR